MAGPQQAGRPLRTVNSAPSSITAVLQDIRNDIVSGAICIHSVQIDTSEVVS